MDFLTLQATLRPTKTAITDLTFDRKWTYAEFDYWVNQLCSWLKEQEINQGDRVACFSKNRAELVGLHIACARLGALFVPLNWRLSSEEVHGLLADCMPKIVLGDELATKIGVECFSIDQLLDQSRACAPSREQKPSSLPSLILYTSGTTGRPKGILHSEDSIMETTLNMHLLAQVNDDSCFLCETPMFHVIGLVSCVRPALYVGGNLVISDGFEPSRTLERMMAPELGITHYFCVPQMANMLRQHPDFSIAKLRNLKGILTGGAPHPEVQIKAWLKDGIPIVDGYGMSEAGTVFGMPFDLAEIDANAGCVGVATHRVEVKLADDNGNEVAANEPGEVLIKGPNLFVGIWGQPELFAASFTPDGWFKTGDIAQQNDNGCYRIVDRKKDMFISGGENVYPVEVEGKILHTENIVECALIGVPDEKWGEVGCAFIVVKPGSTIPSEEDLLAQWATHLAKYKVPKYIRVVDRLPRNGAGKVTKPVLQQWFSQ